MYGLEFINQINTLLGLIKGLLEVVDLNKLPHIFLLVGLTLNYQPKQKKESI